MSKKSTSKTSKTKLEPVVEATATQEPPTAAITPMEPPEITTPPVLDVQAWNALYKPHQDHVAALVQAYQGATVLNDDDRDGYERVKEGAAALVRARRVIDADRKKLTNQLRDAAKVLKEIPDELIAAMAPVEASLKAEKAKFEEAAERRKIAEEQKVMAEFAARMETLYNLGAVSAGEVVQLDEVTVLQHEVKDASPEQWKKIEAQFCDAAILRKNRQEEEAKKRAQESAEMAAMKAQMEAMKEELRLAKVQQLEAWKAAQEATGKFETVSYTMEWINDNGTWRWKASPVTVPKGAAPQPPAEPATPTPQTSAPPAGAPKGATVGPDGMLKVPQQPAAEPDTRPILKRISREAALATEMGQAGYKHAGADIYRKIAEMAPAQPSYQEILSAIAEVVKATGIK